MSFPISIWRANAYDASALGVTDSAVPIYAMPDDGADTIGTAPSLMCRKRSCSACSAPGFLDFQHYRFAERLEGRLDLVEARGVIEPEQTIDGFAIPAETTHQLGAGDTALTQRAIERGLERRHQRQRHRPAARSFGSRRDVLAAGNACRQRLLDRVDGMHEGIGVILAEGGHLRQARAGGKHGAVVVRLELDRIAQRHFSPKSLRILLTKPLPNSFAAAVHRELALTVPAANRHMAAAALVGLEGAALGGQQPPELLCVHIIYSTVLWKSTKMWSSVPSLGFACNSHASCAAASHPIPIICATCSHARWAAKRAMNSRSRSAACITGPRIAQATNAPGGRPPASIPSSLPAGLGGRHACSSGESRPIGARK